jgi:hypothetical protein
VSPEYEETTRSCLHVILEEEWELTASPYATSTRSRRGPTTERVSSSRGAVTSRWCRTPSDLRWSQGDSNP